MDPTLAELLQQHRQQFQSDPFSADPRLIEAAQLLLQEPLQAEILTSEIMRCAEYAYDHLGDKEGMLALLGRYLKQPLSADEAAWARWHRVDYLAMLRRCKEAVKEQQDFLTWAQQNLSSSQWLWVMYDGTQALCWREIEQADSWLALFQGLMTRLRPTPENRFDRHLYLRTAGMLLCRLERPASALPIAEAMLMLAQEEGMWERSKEVQMEAYALRIRAYTLLQDMKHVLAVGQNAQALVEEYTSAFPSLSPFQQERLRVMCHNVALPLFQAGAYGVCIPLWQRAVALGTSSLSAYLYLAAALWVTTRDRTRVLPLLQRAAALSRVSLDLASIAEFQEVQEDPEFLIAVTSDNPLMGKA
jgi:tetratricopeptide (TPR) repeat protein